MTLCQFCGATHGVRCPTVKAIEYHANGKVRRVEFMTPADCSAPSSVYPFPPLSIGPMSPPIGPAIPWWDPFPNKIVCGPDPRPNEVMQLGHQTYWGATERPKQ